MEFSSHILDPKNTRKTHSEIVVHVGENGGPPVGGMGAHLFSRSATTASREQQVFQQFS